MENQIRRSISKYIERNTNVIDQKFYKGKYNRKKYRFFKRNDQLCTLHKKSRQKDFFQFFKALPLSSMKSEIKFTAILIPLNLVFNR